MNFILEKLFFSIFIFSIVVFFDVLFKFKRPFLLKYNFIIITICVGLAAYTHSVDLYSNRYIFLVIICKAFLASSFLNVFSILYFPKFRIWVTIISFLLISLTIYSLYFNLKYNPTYITSLKSQTLFIVNNENLVLPLVLRVLRIILIGSFFFTFIYFLINLNIKLKNNNIYFEKIKIWTIIIFILIILMLILYLPIPILKSNFNVGYSISVGLYFYILFIVIYRPAFLNKSSMKIALGDSFKRNKDLVVNDLDFINQFFTESYFTNPDASLENFAQVLNVGSNDLYKFVYYKYNLTFNDLVNKHRIDYFIDIIHNPKFSNFTIDALAKEVGFSSRQHLYKPFKKFHGGNPSDLIDAVVN